MPIIKMAGYKCNDCGWHWFPRTNDKPKVCPKCKRTTWDTAKSRR